MNWLETLSRLKSGACVGIEETPSIWFQFVRVFSGSLFFSLTRPAIPNPFNVFCRSLSATVATRMQTLPLPFFSFLRNLARQCSQCSSRERKRRRNFLFCNLFTRFHTFVGLFVLAADHLQFVLRETQPVQESVYSYIDIYIKKNKVMFRFFFFSFLHAEVIFSNKKINMNICKVRQNKDVQNKVLNVYCTVYRICLTRRVNVSILRGGVGRSLRSECLQGKGGRGAGLVQVRMACHFFSDTTTTGSNT